MRRSPKDASENLAAEGPLPVFDLASEEISFLNRSMNCCIGFVDMINSTSITAEMVFSDRQRNKVGQYYSIFINTMAVLAKNYGAKIIKNAGDALIFYFPDSSDPSNELAFKDILECFTTMILARDIINAKLHSENLPSVSYRISADYGKVEVATSTSSKGREDLFGSTMNICAKINSMAEPNGIVIGGDLYQIVKSFSFVNNNAYEFRELRAGYSVGFNHMYPIYCVLSKNKAISEIAINSINHLFTSKKTSRIIDVQAKQQQQQQQPSQLLQQSQHKQQPQQKQKYAANIMVVDDELDTLFTYECFLSEEGHNVNTFTDSLEALKHFVQLPDPSSYYKLALLDIRMPRLNGLQLFNTIKKLSPKIKVVFCSALDVAEELTSILPDIKYDDIIKKPVEREYFVSKINSALNRSTDIHFESLHV
ncbi:MAG: response regulator [Thermoproteota archaeon]|nr:response regulator [Thermoproteota archaeon]